MFIRTGGEYTMSALLYGVHNRPVSISIITNMQEYHIGISLAYGVLVIAVCAAVGLVNASLTRRRGTKNENSETGEDSENDGNGVDGRDGGNHPDESAARRKGHRK